MKKRIVAWLLILGFIVLIINIFIDFYRMPSFFIYIVIVAIYLVKMKKK